MLTNGQRERAVGSGGPYSASVEGTLMGSSKILPTTQDADQESRAWVERLSGSGAEHDAALAELHALLLRAARFEVRRRLASSPQSRGGDHDDLAHQSADDALVAILRKLGDFRGDSRFTTWAYKFALYEAATKVRRRSWQGREISLTPEAWPMITEDHQPTLQQGAETSEVFTVLGDAIKRELTPHQRQVLVAITLDDVPIDVLAERLNTTRGALYKTLHDGRQKLRAALATHGLGVDGQKEGAPA
jgi:RNA polymerase sigma-70 factor, ECF subfamily